MKRFVGVLGYLGQSRVCFSGKMSRYKKIEKVRNISQNALNGKLGMKRFVGVLGNLEQSRI